jgi:hypothetical protein
MKMGSDKVRPFTPVTTVASQLVAGAGHSSTSQLNLSRSSQGSTETTMRGGSSRPLLSST